MAGAARADLLVGRVRREAARVADGRRVDARLRLPEDPLRAPEAAEAEDARSVPSGNGGASGVPSTRCVPGRTIGSSRPGSASRGSIMAVFAREKSTATRYPGRRSARRGGWYCRRVATVLLAGVDLFFRGKLEALLPDHHLVTSDSIDAPDLVICDIARIEPDEVVDAWPDVPILGYTNHTDKAGLQRATPPASTR